MNREREWPAPQSPGQLALAVPGAPAPAQHIVVRDEELILFCTPRYNGDELRVTLGSYAGRPVVQLRDWYETADGGWRPSKKGISVPVGQIAEIASALETALEQIARDGHHVPTRGERDPL